MVRRSASLWACVVVSREVSPRPPEPALSHWVDIDGQTHYRDYGGPADGPLIVCIHGLGGSSLNWDLIARHLTDECRVVALDLPGHGPDAGRRRSTSVHANQHLIHRFLTEVTGSPAVLMGNSMGGLLAVVQATSAPTTTAGVVLIAPALPAAGIMVGDLRMVLRNSRTRHSGTRCGDPRAVDAVASAEAQGGSHTAHRHRRSDPAASGGHGGCDRSGRGPSSVLSGTARHVVEAARSVVLMSQSRNYVRRLRELATPVLLIHGGRDRVVSARSAQAAAARRPEWTFHLIEDVGHVPRSSSPSHSRDDPAVAHREPGCGPGRSAGLTPARRSPNNTPGHGFTHPSTLNAPHRNVRTVNWSGPEPRRFPCPIA